MREKKTVQLEATALTATGNGAEIDLAKYIHVGNREVKAFAVAIPTGAETDETWDGKLQESVTTVDTDFTDITGATFTQVAKEATAAFEEIHAVVKKRYLRIVSTLAGTTPAFTVAAGAILDIRSTT